MAYLNTDIRLGINEEFGPINTHLKHSKFRKTASLGTQ
jgi:hypothetical protein